MRGGGTKNLSRKRKKLEKKKLPFVHVQPRVSDELPPRPREGVEGAQGRGDVRETRERAGEGFLSR